MDFLFLTPNGFLHDLGGSVGKGVDEGKKEERAWGKEGGNAVTEGGGNGRG